MGTFEAEEIRKRKREAELGLLTATSVIWVVGLFIIGSIFPKENKIWELAANNLGDFLAGVFSPIAALWFVYAVFMQREELELQRRQIKLSIEEQKISSDALKKQSEIMLEEWKETKSTLNRDRYIRNICDQIKIFYADKYIYNISGKDYKNQRYVYEINIIYIFEYEKLSTEADVIRFIRGLTDHSNQTIEYLNQEDLDEILGDENEIIGKISEIRNFFKAIYTSSESISLPSVVAHIAILNRKLEEIESLMKKFRRQGRIDADI